MREKKVTKMSNNFWSFIVVIGLIGWVVSSVVFILKAFPERGRIEIKLAASWATLSVVSFSIWIVGMLNA